MTLTIGTALPDFEAASTHGTLRLHDWLGGKWALIFAFKAMSPTCSTEFAELQTLHAAFAASDARVLGVSIDTEQTVAGWLDHLRDMFDCSPSFPLVNDSSGEVPALLGLVDTLAAQPSLTRTAYVVAPDKRIAMSMTYPVTNGRSIAEILRTLKGAQLTAARNVATSSTWTDGQPVMLPPSLSQEQADTMYPQGVQVLRPYLRIVAQP
ncbi:redoxin domain-containing protein [Burkholderia multivorans]|uniref:redoxin domain-containing protein n=1 Tax=Burkholderia multivorans TaxID=87883 RepID=UPI001C26E0F7|nr:redoxin domain-containing protein [Burkholderia multivorans]MBU9597995.1 redoxin domain-containing protein [Burkholderia multivorans]